MQSTTDHMDQTQQLVEDAKRLVTESANEDPQGVIDLADQFGFNWDDPAEVRRVITNSARLGFTLAGLVQVITGLSPREQIEHDPLELALLAAEQYVVAICQVGHFAHLAAETHTAVFGNQTSARNIDGDIDPEIWAMEREANGGALEPSIVFQEMIDFVEQLRTSQAA